MDVRKLIREEVLCQEAYPVETLSCPVKLDANENPLGLPPELKDELAARLAAISLNRYPEAGSIALTKRFALSLGVDEGQLMIGSGSDELIQILCTALAKLGAEVLIPVPTFAMYRITALNNGFKVNAIPLDDAFDLDVQAMGRQIFRRPPALTFLAWPNNPTANCFSAERIEALLAASPGIVVVDEAYFHFSGRTFLPELSRYENLVILRTLSKVGLAALRVGLLIGSQSLVHELNKVRLPYNLNTLSQAAAGFYLDHEEVFREQAARVLRWRDDLVAALTRIPGVHPYPSDANFIFFSCDFDGNRVYKLLLELGVLVKPFANPQKQGDKMLRVTVGTEEDNRVFIQALKEVLTK
ncbi:MAG: histidinol-phosphate transaminase [Syntrophaceae bacterium]|nr:histidinol-phosphate transaminase [Syntrophaceae bacterium]